jgi:hypothetical protein
MIQETRKCWLVQGSPQKIELDAKDRLIELTLHPWAPNFAAGARLQVIHVQSVRVLPYTVAQRERAAWLEDLESGALQTIAPDDFAYAVDLPKEVIDGLIEKHVIAVISDAHGEPHITAAEVARFRREAAAEVARFLEADGALAIAAATEARRKAEKGGEA